MRKFLLGAFALFAALAVNAQTETGYRTVTFTTQDTDGNDVYTTVGSDSILINENGTYIDWYTGTNDDFKDGGASGSVTVNNVTVTYKGAVGGTNPSMGRSPQNQGYPTAGGYFVFNAKGDGYLYILAKVNTEKNYLVFEDGVRIPYIWSADYSTTGTTISFDLNEVEGAVEDGYISDNYKILTAKDYCSDSNETLASESKSTDCAAGVIMFPVKKGSSYAFCGTGTRCAVGAYYFDTTGNATITYTDNNVTYTLLKDGQIASTEEEGNDEDETTITVSDDNYCTFAASNEINQTGDITFTLTSNDNSTVTGTGHGTVSLNQNGTEKKYDCCLKLNSHPTLSFSTTEKMTMTLVFEDDDNLKDSSHTDRCITIDGTSSTITSGRVMQVVLESGYHSLTRVSGTEHYLFYVGLSTGDTTGINGVTLQTTGNNIYYNLAGQRVSSPTKGVYILNGKKILVK
ncbi:MAG: hypothetical protein LUC88_08385 [Prevotella sp.]|nr:hypothetical protein [Prevotella sp.]